MAKGFSVWATLKGKDAASGPITRALGKIRVAGKATGAALKWTGAGILAGGAAVGGAAVGIWKLANSYASAADEESKFARQNRISIGALQEMNFVAGREGVTVDALRLSITGLMQNVGQMAAGRGRALKFLSALKGGKEIARDLTKSTTAIEAMDVALNAIRSAKGVGQKAALAKALGFDPTMVRLAARTGKEINDLRKLMRGYGTDTEKSGIAAEDFKDAQENLQGALLGLHRTVGGKLMPTLTTYVDRLTAFVSDHKTDIAGWADRALKGFESFARDGIPAVIDGLNKAKPVFEALGKILIPVADAIVGMTKSAPRSDFTDTKAIGFYTQNITGYTQSEIDAAGGLVRRAHRTNRASAKTAEQMANGDLVPGSVPWWRAVQVEAEKLRLGRAANTTGMSMQQIMQQQSRADGRVDLNVSVSDDRVTAKAIVVEGGIGNIVYDDKSGTPEVFQ